MPRSHRFSASSTVAWLGTALALGWPGLPAAAADGGLLDGVQVQLENDMLARPRSDRWYTNGIRLSKTFVEPPDTVFGRLMHRGGDWFLWDQAETRITYTLGQTMYTPQNIRRATPQVFDRPWGAMLYFGTAVHASRQGEFRATELKLGTTGRHALGEQAQRAVHRLTNSPMPAGWDLQLRARPVVQLSHLRVHPLDRPGPDDVFGLQWNWGVSLGTVRNYATAGVTALIGRLARSDSPAVIGNEGDFVVQDFSNRPQFARPFGFVSAAATGVAYNYFLEGRAPYGRSEIDPRRGHVTVQWGLSLPLQCWIGAKWPRLVLMQTRRSPEFDSPAAGSRDAIQRWGTLTLNWDTDDGGRADCR